MMRRVVFLCQVGEWESSYVGENNNGSGGGAENNEQMEVGEDEHPFHRECFACVWSVGSRSPW